MTLLCKIKTYSTREIRMLGLTQPSIVNWKRWSIWIPKLQICALPDDWNNWEPCRKGHTLQGFETCFLSYHLDWTYIYIYTYEHSWISFYRKWPSSWNLRCPIQVFWQHFGNIWCFEPFYVRKLWPLIDDTCRKNALLIRKLHGLIINWCVFTQNFKSNHLWDLSPPLVGIPRALFKKSSILHAVAQVCAQICIYTQLQTFNTPNATKTYKYHVFSCWINQEFSNPILALPSSPLASCGSSWQQMKTWETWKVRCVW